MIYDVHAHVFPDKIARRAGDMISKFYDLAVPHDGTVQTLFELGDLAGIDRFLVHSVALTPHNVASINTFIAGTAREHSSRATGFFTLHPDMEKGDMERAFRDALDNGLKGLKVHPDMQSFALDEQRADRMFAMCEGVCPVLIHTGDKRYRYSNPDQTKTLLRKHPRLIVIGAHFGGWSEWQKACRELSGENLYVDTSSSFYALNDDEIREAIAAFGEDRVLFGSDYPMWSPVDEMSRLRALSLDKQAEEKIMGGNLSRLLGETSPARESCRGYSDHHGIRRQHGQG